MQNLKLTIAYDGTKYQGYQKNKNASNTIQEKLNSTFSKYFNTTVECIASGRTDKGAHALGQVINFKVDTVLTDLQALKSDLNNYLPHDIVIKSIERVEELFHSRFNAVEKTYQYRIWKFNADVPPLFERNYVYVLDRKIKSKYMRAAIPKLIGEHDFKAFSSDKTKKSTVRTISDITIDENENELIISFTGNGFLYNMVRILTGTLVEIGAKERKLDSIDKIFQTNNREDAGYTVPANGLFLMDVKY